MVVTLGPGKFYGSSLPRPRIYTDLKLNQERVDPPLPVTDPLLAWANEAHWSMGGLSLIRYRLQGRIEGNAQKLRAQLDKQFKKKPKIQKKQAAVKEISQTPSPPVVIKRRRMVVDEEVLVGVKRNLADEFEAVAARTRSKNSSKTQ